MFQFEIQSFAYKDFDSWCLPWDYHCLYILENGYQVYIGETKEVIRRSKEHCLPSDFCNQFHFQHVYVITSEDFRKLLRSITKIYLSALCARMESLKL